MRSRLLPILLAAGCLAAPASAVAGPPGTWTRFTDANLSNTAQVGAARTADGRLHVLWANKNRSAILESDFSPSGKSLGRSTVVSGWSTLNNPALVTDATGTGLAAFWGSQRGQSDPDPNADDTQAFRPAGAPWTIGSAFSKLATDGADDGAYLQSMSATRLGATYLQAFGDEVHSGLTPALPSHHLEDLFGGACCGYDANVASDATSAHAAWYSNATGRTGVWTVPITPSTGAPAGVPRRMPGTTGVGSTQNRTPIVATAGHYFTAYPGGSPAPNRALVWREGAKKSMVVAKGADVRAVALARGDDGRLWVVIGQSLGIKQRITVRHSNAAITKWGPPTVLKLPKKTATIWTIEAVGGTGRLDVLAHLSAKGSHEATWQTSVLPALTLKAKPGKIARHDKTTVTFTVTDAGKPIAGATVKVAGKKGTTSTTGKVALKLGPFAKKAKAKTARASHGGYAPAKLKIRFKKK